MAKIYVTSSWRNQYYPEVVETLRSAGYEVYDFRNPPHGKGGFHWSDIDALKLANTFVLVIPCGRSAHTEVDRMAGSGR